MSKPNWRQQLEEKERREKEREEQMRREKEEKLRQLQMEAKSAADAAPSLAVIEESHAELGLVDEQERLRQEEARLTKHLTANVKKKELTPEEIAEAEQKRIQQEEEERRAEEMRLKVEARLKAWEAKHGKPFTPGGAGTTHTTVIEHEEVELGMPSEDPEVIKKRAAAARLNRLLFK